jgi:hypothetical protein
MDGDPHLIKIRSNGIRHQALKENHLWDVLKTLEKNSCKGKEKKIKR